MAFSVRRALLLTLMLSVVVPGSFQSAFNLPAGIRFQEALLLAVGFLAFIDWVYRRHLDVRPSPLDGPLLAFLALCVGATAVGLAQGAIDAAVGYAKDRNQFGRPIGDFQAIQFMLAEMLRSPLPVLSTQC